MAADGIICNFGKRTKGYREGKTFTVSPIDYYRHVAGYSFCLNTGGYITYSSRKDGLHLKFLHRVIMDVTDPKICIDHINHSPTDNRRDNLRLCSHQENQHNASIRKDNKSGLKGVSFNKQAGKFRARIRVVNGKHKFLGYHQTKEEAHLAYQEASVKYHGDFGHDGIQPPPEILNLIHESTLDSETTRVKTFFHRNVNTKFDQIPLSNPDHEKWIRDWVQKSASLHTGESVL